MKKIIIYKKFNNMNMIDDNPRFNLVIIMIISIFYQIFQKYINLWSFVVNTVIVFFSIGILSVLLYSFTQIGKEYLIGMSLLIISIIIITILYSILYIKIDLNTWEKKKCLPKYLFISGFIKKNENKNSIQSTIQNFNDCIRTFILEENKLDTTLNKSIENKNKEIITRVNDKITPSFDKYKMSMDEINDEIATNLEQITNSANNDIMSNINYTKQNIIGLKNEIMNIKNYGHKFLSYLALKYVILHRKQSDIELEASYNYRKKCKEGGNNFKYFDKYCVNDNGDKIPKTTYYRKQMRKVSKILNQLYGGAIF